MTITATNLPKAAQALVDDAKAAGCDVKVGTWGSGADVTVNSSNASITVTWTVQQHGGSKGGGLSFYTTSGKSGVRFAYAEGRQFGKAVRVTSVKRARALLGLAA